MRHHCYPVLAYKHCQKTSMATRNIKDFTRCGVPLINPFDPQKN